MCLIVHVAMKVLDTCIWYLDGGCFGNTTRDNSLFKTLKKCRGGAVTPLVMRVNPKLWVKVLLNYLACKPLKMCSILKVLRLGG